MEVERVNRTNKNVKEETVQGSGVLKRQWENQYAWRGGFWLSENQFGEADYKDPCNFGLSSMKIEVCINCIHRGTNGKYVNLFNFWKDFIVISVSKNNTGNMVQKI